MRLRYCLLIGALALLPACNRDSKPVIGVVPKGASHLFWQTVHAGALKAGAEFGYAIEWNSPPTEVDTSRQIDIVQSMVTRKLAGIALAPIDRQAMITVVERAGDAGIPVAIWDSGLDSERKITYIATDNLESGRMAARRLGERIGGKGKVAVIGFKPGSASTMEREQGFADELKAKYPGTQIVALQFGMSDRAKALAVTENVLAAHPDLVGLYADNESSLAGAVQALKSRNLRKVVLVGMDASEQLIADLKEGWIDAIVVQNPFKMGYESVKAIADHRAGKKVAPVMDTGATLILPANVDEPAIRELLFPDLKRWLEPASSSSK